MMYNKRGVKHPSALILSVIMGLSLFAGCGGGSNGNGSGSGTATKPEDQTQTIVESRFVNASINLDGMDDEDIWNTIDPVTVQLESGVFFDMKSFYDDDNVYFLFKWIDMDEGPLSTIGKWFIDRNDKWTWDFNSDGFSIVWDVMKAPNFAYEACTPLCHDQPSDLNRRYMGTDNPRDIQEFWNWNPGVTNAKGIMAAYLWEALPSGVTVDDPDFDNKITWGLLPGEYGFYHNRARDEIAPGEQIVGNEAPLWIIEDVPASGDAALVKAFGAFHEPFYILEVSRPRRPSNPDLHKFTVADNGWSDILFAAAIFMNNERDKKTVQKEAATLRMVGKNVEK